MRKRPVFLVLLSISLAPLFEAPAPAAEETPLPEHPRPIFRRDEWRNLNGKWGFEFDASSVGEEAGWYRKGAKRFAREIVVPYPWEAKLSGIGDTEYRGAAWYARAVTVPAAWNGNRVWLCFGAVDWHARVWVNGHLVGEHAGGYTPFAFDITDAAAPGEEAFIVVRADDTTSPEQPTGKQTGWYTRSSGIWQTVYLEARGGTHLERAQVVTRLRDSNREAAIEVAAFLGGPAADIVVTLGIGDRALRLAKPDAGNVARGTLTVSEPRLWSPDDPYLYGAVFRVLRGEREVDRVHSYVGIREISTARAPGGPYRYIHLNGRPVYLRGALHQSFHPDGIYQYPDDRTIRWDYEYAKRIGLNFLRIHIKTEIPRALYWADKLGVLIMEDQPNFSRYTEASRRNWELVLRETVARDFNNPSIIAWCNFNETWGIGHGGYDRDNRMWVRDMYRLTKRLDPTRLVEDNSPCLYDHVVTDINSWHFYINDYQRARDHIAGVVRQTFPGSTFNYAEGSKQSDAPLINSEYGGISAGLGDQDISWCFKYLTNELRKHDKICGYVYTEQSDIEWEHNGFLNYDRTEKVYGYDYWFPGFSLADLNRPDFVVLDIEPCPAIEPGQTLAVPVLLSHWSTRETEDLTLRWRLDYLDRWGERTKEAAAGTRPARWEPYRVVPAGKIEVKVPDEGPAVGALLVWVTDARGERLAANYVNFHTDVSAPRVEVVDPKRIALRFAPNEFSAFEWAEGTIPTGSRSRHKVSGRGAGFVEYELAIPEEAPGKGLSSVEVLLEASAKAGDEKLAWPARKRSVDYPQTDKETRWPSDLAVSISGAKALETTLADDPADARGALSHRYRYQPGSYGWLVRAETGDGEHPETLAAIRKERRIRLRFEVPRDAARPGGLAVFGERLGRYPVDPTALLTYRDGHGVPATVRSQAPVTRNRLVAARETVVATAEDQGAVWRYTTERPASGWEGTAFVDSVWKEGRGGFGRRGTPGAIVGTRWRSPDIWLRKRFDLSRPETVQGAILRFYHDEDIEIYLNGERVAAAAGYVTGYVETTLGRDRMRLLRPEGNVLAVHCRQTGGGQNVDVGLSVLRKNR